LLLRACTRAKWKCNRGTSSLEIAKKFSKGGIGGSLRLISSLQVFPERAKFKGRVPVILEVDVPAEDRFLNPEVSGRIAILLQMVV
jgi:hypothetical protein